MLLIRRHNARKIWPLLRAKPTARKGSTRVTEEMLVAGTPVAEKLKETKLWKWGRGKKAVKGPVGDKHRVNIVSEKLCGKHQNLTLLDLLLADCCR